MSLSDFMPYGAPELIEGAEPRMARATMVASGLVAALVWCLGIVAANHRVVRELPPVFPVMPSFDPKLYEPDKPRSPGPVIPVIPKFVEPVGVLHPVAEVPPELPKIDERGPIGPVSPERGEPDVPRGNAQVQETCPCADPAPDAFVYTDEVPQLVRSVKPFYPDLPREAGVEGTVKLQLLIGLDGRVIRAIVRRGGSVPMLDEAAISAALQCVFTPALANGRPVKVWVTQDYRFTLH
jgi:protein TonB